MKAEGVPDIMNITEYFVGQNDGNGQFSCMHGQGECVGDMLELCAQAIYKDSTSVPAYAWYDFGTCMQGPDFESIPQNAQSCAEKVGLDWSTLNTCASGSQGQKLFANSISYANTQGIYATPTNSINGKVYVGGPNYPLEVICEAYTGTKPAGCQNSAPSDQQNLREELCYVKDMVVAF